MTKKERRQLAQLIYYAYPDWDLLGFRPPKKRETIQRYRRYCEKLERRGLLGDTLFLHIVRELSETNLDMPTIRGRLRRIQNDVEKVLSACTGTLTMTERVDSVMKSLRQARGAG